MGYLRGHRNESDFVPQEGDTWRGRCGSSFEFGKGCYKEIDNCPQRQGRFDMDIG